MSVGMWIRAGQTSESSSPRSRERLAGQRQLWPARAGRGRGRRSRGGVAGGGQGAMQMMIGRAGGGESRGAGRRDAAPTPSGRVDPIARRPRTRRRQTSSSRRVSSPYVIAARHGRLSLQPLANHVGRAESELSGDGDGRRPAGAELCAHMPHLQVCRGGPTACAAALAALLPTWCDRWAFSEPHSDYPANLQKSG